jgi:hypothetical protein
MVLAAVIFVAVLFVVGVWCILLVRDSLKKSAEAREYEESHLRSRFQPVTSRQQDLIRARAAARREAERQRAERWKSLTPTLVSQAFKNFYEDDANSGYDASHVSAAFEKFTKEMSVKH